jgi:hypothetical protein
MLSHCYCSAVSAISLLQQASSFLKPSSFHTSTASGSQDQVQSQQTYEDQACHRDVEDLLDEVPDVAVLHHIPRLR